MPQAFNIPGVYRVEKDISTVVRPVGTSTGAIVGKANQGPVNQRVLVNTDKQFIQTFGKPVSANDYAHYAAIQFLAESQNLWMVRCTYGDEIYANMSFSSQTSSTSAVNVSAASTTNALAAYVDGYSMTSQVGDAGNGDIEAAVGLTDDILIASIGPGTYGNNIGVAIVASASPVSAQYGFNWMYKYDDALNVSAATATWRKVYRINVYTKPEGVTALAAWGATSASQISAMQPAETFLVSNDPTAKDANGKSLYAPYVINGFSSFIYVQKTGLGTAVPTDKSNLGIVQLQNGFNSISATSDEKLAALDLFKDRTKCGIDILMVADAVDSTVSSDLSYVQKAGNIAASRQDCIAAVQATSQSDKTQALINAALARYSFDNPSYAALYIGYDIVYDQYTDSNVFVAKSVAGAAIMVRTDRVANVWDAPAGVNRGIIGYSIGQNEKLSEAAIGSIYDNNGNCSKFVTGYGNVMWGQKTAQKKATALDRINVRRLLLYIENTIEPSLLPFLFEINNTQTRSRVFGVIDQFLSRVQSGGGLNAYKLVCDSTNNSSQDIDNNQLNVDIYVQPAKTIEFIKMQTIITRSGVNFNELV